MRKLISLLISVNYGDTLKKIIKNNLSIVDKCIIVTTTNDIETINIANDYNVICLLSNSCYDNNSSFNKSKMINIGLKYIYSSYPNDVYLIMDADIYLNSNIRKYINEVKQDYIYGTNRYIIKDTNIDLSNIKNIDLNLYELEYSLEKYHCCIGYIQLFIDKKFYDENFKTAAESDEYFAKSFKYNEIMEDCNVIHLGEIGKNWNGKI